MSSLSIVEHLDVLEQICSGFILVAVADPDDTFPLEDSEEAFHNGIIIAVTRAAHGAGDAMPGQFAAEIIT